MTESEKSAEEKAGQLEENPWYAKAYKWVTTSSHRDDWHPDVYKNFDPDKWVEAIASCGPDVLFFQSKGCSGNAYYQTELEHTHLGLKGRDAMGEVLELCHQRGIRFAVNQEILFDNYLYKTHPDWRIRDAEGRDSKALLGDGRPGVVCLNSPYRDLVLAQVDALAKKYPLDGIFYDMVFNWLPVCYCRHCRSLYQEECESELPAGDDRSSPEFRRYVHWRDKRLHDFTRDLVDTFKAHRPDGMATFNSPRPYKGAPSVLERAFLADVLMGDPYQGDWSSQSTSFACNAWSNMTKKQVAPMAVGRMHGHEAQHTGSRSVDELMVSSAICSAYNCATQFFDGVNVDGTLYESPFLAYKAVFDMMRPLEPLLGGEKIRSVGIYISDRTNDYLYESGPEQQSYVLFGPAPVGPSEQYTSGLVEAFGTFQKHHIPVDMITRLRLDRLEDYSLLVVPDAMCMSDEETDYIRRYVRNGGNLVATRLTSLADEDGNRRHNFALSDVFGVDYLGETENNETYMGIPPELCREAGIPEDMEVKVDRQAIVAAHAEAEALGRIILPYTNRENDAQRWMGLLDSPPGPLTDHPAVVMNEYGKGRSCYLSARVHALEPHFSVEEPRELMYALGRSMRKDSVPLTADGPPWLVVTGFRKPEENAIVVHLVNAPREVPVLPLRDIRVTLRLIDGEEVSSVVAHPDQEQLGFEREGDVASFTVPKVGPYQVIVVGLRQSQA